MQFDLSSELKKYLSSGQKDLIKEGIDLLEHIRGQKATKFHDYSFLVFPFAKAYEGFLKQILLDVNFISKEDYFSDHFRIGQVLSPNLVEKLKQRSVYQKICDRYGGHLADQIWHTWKIGRNQVFHYFPHNLRSINFEEANTIIIEIIKSMNQVVNQFKVKRKYIEIENNTTITP